MNKIYWAATRVKLRQLGALDYEVVHPANPHSEFCQRDKLQHSLRIRFALMQGRSVEVRCSCKLFLLAIQLYTNSCKLFLLAIQTYCRSYLIIYPDSSILISFLTRAF